MRHTPQQQARRAALADAAAGGHEVGSLARVRVVLYDRMPARGGSPALPVHRVFAEARDWTVVTAITDAGPLEASAMTWPLWPRVAELVESRQVDGIVTSPWATSDGDFLGWLRERHAFVAFIDGPLGSQVGVDARAPETAL
ncbi:hypothetical protein ACIQRC_33155 [Streptomyces californicus]|uniref:hypothetical protein n=1 Tax=Streptomyces californicus TaxID=67351 RepID=UPI003800A39A